MPANSEVPKVTVTCSLDGEAGVWYVSESNLPGLAADAESLDELASKLRLMILDILEARFGDEQNQYDEVPVDLLIHDSLSRTNRHC